MTKFADLHIHTCFSDSSSSPQDVVRQAVAQGLSCIAITDHDTVDGVMPTVQAAQDYDLEIVSGVELSCEVDNKDIHILGYFVDCQNENFAKNLLEKAGYRNVQSDDRTLDYQYIVTAEK